MTSKRSRIGAVACVAASATLGAGAGTALADPAHGTPSTLTLTPQSPPRAGATTIIQATGNNPPSGAGSAYGHFYLDVYVLSSAYGSNCPASWIDGAQNSTAALARARPESSDPSGNFSIPLTFNDTQAESVLVCGYTDDGTSFGTAASASLPITVAPASGNPPPPPSGSTPPPAGNTPPPAASAPPPQNSKHKHNHKKKHKKRHKKGRGRKH